MCNTPHTAHHTQRWPSSGEEQASSEAQGSDFEPNVATPRRSARLKATTSLGSFSPASGSSLSSLSHTPSTSSISTSNTTPPLSPKPALPLRTPLRKVRIPALKGKAAARRLLANGGESNKAAGLGIPVEATPIHNSSILASPMSTALHPASEHQSPTKPKLESESNCNIPSGPTPSPSKQFLSFPSRQISHSTSAASSIADVPRTQPEIKQDEFLAELTAPLIRRPITSGIWRIIPEDIPARCSKQHPDSMKNRVIWSNQQQRKLIAMGFEADLEIESVVFLRDGCMISWKTKIPVYPDTLKIHDEAPESPTTITTFGSSSSPEGFRRSSRTRRRSWKTMLETSPSLTRSRSSKNQTSASDFVDVPSPSPAKQKKKHKTGTSNRIQRSNIDDVPSHTSITNRVRPTVRRSVSPPSRQVEPSRITSAEYPRSPSASSVDREDAEMVEQLLIHTSRSPSPMPVEDVHNSHHDEARISSGSDDDMYMSWSDYEKARIVPVEPSKNGSSTTEVLPSRSPDKPERRPMGVPVPMFSFENRVSRVPSQQEDLGEKTISTETVDSAYQGVDDMGMDTSW